MTVIVQKACEKCTDKNHHLSVMNTAILIKIIPHLIQGRDEDEWGSKDTMCQVHAGTQVPHQVTHAVVLCCSNPTHTANQGGIDIKANASPQPAF